MISLHMNLQPAHTTGDGPGAECGAEGSARQGTQRSAVPGAVESCFPWPAHLGAWKADWEL